MGGQAELSSLPISVPCHGVVSFATMSFSIMDSIREGTRIFVGRLPQDARERDLERFFKGYGR